MDYKAGAPKEGEDANELWDTDKMQLGLQALILRDNGYTCGEGVIYYRAAKQRVRLPITPELETWILQNIAEAKRVIAGPIPPPLVYSPKCVRCSLAPVCLPDETRMLASPTSHPASGHPFLSDGKGAGGEGRLRRLMAARDDTRPLYLNTPGYRVGCKDEVLQVKDKDKLIEEVRMRDVSHVALFGNIQISTQAIQALCEQEVPVTYFSMGGWFYGITRGHGLKNVFLRMEQLMEEFRPLIAESTVLSCINNRVVTEKDFVRAGQAVNLSAPGRKRFFQTYEQRMSSLITHPLFDYKVSYRRALELQARLLAKTLAGEIVEYIPLMTR